MVPLFSSEVERAKATLKKLYSLGFVAPEYESYIRTEAPWAAREAVLATKRQIEHSLASERADLAAQWDSIKNAPY